MRYAFEYARRHDRKKVTVFMKDNIMKMTDGLFHKVFDEIAKEYPDIQNEPGSWTSAPPRWPTGRRIST